MPFGYEVLVGGNGRRDDTEDVGQESYVRLLGVVALERSESLVFAVPTTRPTTVFASVVHAA